MADRVVFQDRRGEDRSDCELRAKIEFVDGGTADCIVKDLSPTGVRIAIEPAIHVPEQFGLLVPAIPDADQRFTVKLVWRHDAEIGGEFISPPR